MCGFLAFSLTRKTAAAPSRTKLERRVGGGCQGFEGKGKKSKRSGSTHMPMTMLMKACLEAVLGVRREDIMDRERGRRSIVATAMNAGWYGNSVSPSGGG